MSTEQYRELINALFEFVKRASKKDATEAEIAILPTVASLLIDLTNPAYRN